MVITSPPLLTTRVLIPEIVETDVCASILLHSMHKVAGKLSVIYILCHARPIEAPAHGVIQASLSVMTS